MNSVLRFFFILNCWSRTYRMERTMNTFYRIKVHCTLQLDLWLIPDLGPRIKMKLKVY